MVAFVLVGTALLGFSPTDRSEYQAASARAGRDAGAHLKLAVWCEAHGMGPERLAHLAEALAIDPQNAAARGLMGLVSYSGRWLPPEKVEETVKADQAMAAKLAQYEAKRQATPPTAEAQWQLALWCEKNGLKAEATAHFTAVTQIAPRRTEAWKKLGCELYRGRWIDAEQVAAERADAEAQKKADRHWEPILLRWKKELVLDSTQRKAAEAALAEITDTRAVPTIQRVLGHGNRVQQETAVEMLSRIECPASSHALGVMSLIDRWPKVRTVAIRELKRRDPRDFIEAMIGLMRRPFTFHVSKVGSSDESGMVVMENDRVRAVRVYEVPQVVAKVPGTAGYVAADLYGGWHPIGPTSMTPMQAFVGMSPEMQLRQMANIDQAAAHLMRYARFRTERILEQDLAALQQLNDRVERANETIACALQEITGQKLGRDRDAWLTWWNDQLGLRYERTETPEKKTIVEVVPIWTPLHTSCFAAGTPVPTLTGPRPIESLKVGDVILSQDTVTGVLGYQPILGVHHNRPAQTVRVRLKDETVVCTPVHRFWRPGRGWAMARDLKPGDSIRTVGGRAEVLDIKPDVVQPVFNLDVARNHTFFVGSQKALVRDNSLPPSMLTPFDAEPSLASIADNPGPAGARGAEVHPIRAGRGISRPEAGPGSEELASPGRKASILGPRTVQPAVRPPG